MRIALVSVTLSELFPVLPRQRKHRVYSRVKNLQSDGGFVSLSLIRLILMN